MFSFTFWRAFFHSADEREARHERRPAAGAVSSQSGSIKIFRAALFHFASPRTARAPDGEISERGPLVRKFSRAASEKGRRS